jgi:hypothetical protein
MRGRRWGGGDGPPRLDDRCLACSSLACPETRAAEGGGGRSSTPSPHPPDARWSAPGLGEAGNPSSRTASLKVGDEGRPAEDESVGEPEGETDAEKAHHSLAEGIEPCLRGAGLHRGHHPTDGPAVDRLRDGGGRREGPRRRRRRGRGGPWRRCRCSRRRRGRSPISTHAGRGRTRRSETEGRRREDCGSAGSADGDGWSREILLRRRPAAGSERGFGSGRGASRLA